MLCSVILPTRARPYGLHVALSSIFWQASDPKNIEAFVGIDEDDDITIARLGEFKRYPNTEFIVEPRQHISLMCKKMIQRAKGTWILLFNDDASLIGSGWDTELAKHPTDKVILQPEIHRLGGSTYHRDTGSAFPFFPKSFWDQVVVKEGMSLYPEDSGVPAEALKRGWKIDFVLGLTAFHDHKPKA